MFSTGSGRVAPAIVLLSLFLALLLWVAPSELSLGRVVKLVYLHGAAIWSGVALFSVAAGIGLLYLAMHLLDAGKRAYGALWRAAGSAWIAGVGTWTVAVGLSVISMLLAWGTVYWAEPKFVASASTMLVAWTVCWLCREFQSPAACASLYSLTAVAAWAATAQSGRIMHPLNPIANSPSPKIKAFYLAIVACVLLISSAFAYTCYRGSKTDNSC